nr:hypothetical protein [Phytoactinopolyspora halophila]
MVFVGDQIEDAVADVTALVLAIDQESPQVGPRVRGREPRQHRESDALAVGDDGLKPRF